MLYSPSRHKIALLIFLAVVENWKSVEVRVLLVRTVYQERSPRITWSGIRYEEEPTKTEVGVRVWHRLISSPPKKAYITMPPAVLPLPMTPTLGWYYHFDLPTICRWASRTCPLNSLVHKLLQTHMPRWSACSEVSAGGWLLKRLNSQLVLFSLP